MRHKLERKGRTYYVVNAGQHFGLPVTRPTLVLVLRKSRACALVDRIEEMLEIEVVRSLPRAFSGEERRWYRGLALIGDSVIPVVHPSGFLTPGEISLLDAARAAADAAAEACRNGRSRRPMSATVPEGGRSFVLLRLTTRRFALPAETVIELVVPGSLQRFPHTSPLLLGVLVRRGQVVPVADIAQVVAGPESAASEVLFDCDAAFRRGARMVRDSGDGGLRAGQRDAGGARGRRPGLHHRRVHLGEEQVPILDLDGVFGTGVVDDSLVEAQP